MYGLFQPGIFMKQKINKDVRGLNVTVLVSNDEKAGSPWKPFV